MGHPAADKSIADLAAVQHGAVSTGQCHDVGLDRSAIRRRVSSGFLVPIGPRSFRLAGAPDTWRQRLHAVSFDLGPTALVSHRAAAALHGFDSFTEGAIEFTVPRRNRERASVPVLVLHSSGTLPPLDRCTIENFAATSAARTIVDLAAVSTVEQIGRAVDSAVRDGSASADFLGRRLAELRGAGRDGVRRVDRALIDGGGHSHLERRFLALMRQHGLPRPMCQVVHRVEGRTVARVDFQFPGSAVIVEVLGWRPHSSSERQRHDLRRHAELASMGYVVLPFSYGDVVERPEFVVGIVRAALSAALGTRAVGKRPLS